MTRDFIDRKDAIAVAMNVSVFHPSASQGETNTAVMVLAKVETALRALPGSPAPGAPVVWQSMDSAPRDGKWFWAETAGGSGRWVHFADRFDRYPINQEDNCWATEPVRWLADYLDAPPSVAALQAQLAAANADADRLAGAVRVVCQHGRIDDSESHMNMCGAALAAHEARKGGV